MEECPQCHQVNMMGRGYRASGVCRECFEKNDLALKDRRPRIAGRAKMSPGHGRTAKASEPAVKIMSGLEDALAHVKGEPGRAIETTVCPTCGHRLKPMSNAERQRAYRERRKSCES